VSGAALRLLRPESGQNTFEYLLVIGAFAVLFAFALLTGFQQIFHQFIGILCPSVDPVGSSGVGQCLGG
jgi:hypothetical protein